MEVLRSEICLSCGRCAVSSARQGDGIEHAGRCNTYQRIRLPDLIGRLLQPSLRRVDAPIALVDILLQVAHVVVIESELLLLGRRHALIFRLERLAVHLGAGTQVLLGVGEEIMRTGAGEEGAADFGVGDGELGAARGGAGAHELLCAVG